jgi:HSP20 family protein
MPIIRWNQVNNLDEFESLLPEVWTNRGLDAMPSLDVYQTDQNVVVEAQLPGYNPDQVKVNIENDVLTISGQSEQKSEVDEQHYYRREIRHGQFHRAVALPTSVDGQKATAKYENGLLTVTIPIQERAKPTQVKIETA